MSEFIEKLKFYLIKNSKWNGDCLETTYKHKKNRRTPQVCINKKNISVHRASWIVNHGKIPEGMCVLHKCDNPNCFRIEHLFLGTLSDNMNDMIKKKRDNMFGRRKYSFETLKKAMEYKEQGFTYKKIAEILNAKTAGISASLIREKKRINSSQTVLVPE